MLSSILIEPLSLAGKMFIAREILAGLILLAVLFACLILMLLAALFVQEAGHRLREWLKPRGSVGLSSRPAAGGLIAGINR